MRRPFGLMFALLALWLQALSPAVAARMAVGPAFDPTAIICDHLGQANAPQPVPGQDEHDRSCCLVHHHLGAANLDVAPAPGLAHVLRSTTTLVQTPGDDPALGGTCRADLHARGPPRPL